MFQQSNQTLYRMKSVIITILLIPIYFLSIAQTDSLVFHNGNYMVGEIKSLDRNVLVIETDYSDSDFTIEWDGIKEIYTKTTFLITLSDGRRFNGILKSGEDKEITILTDGGGLIFVEQNEIVMMNDIDKGFWNQVYASIDVGLEMYRSNNLRQFTLRSNAGYIAKRWQVDGNYNTLFSQQDEISDTRRTDGSGTFRYFLPHDWYPLVSAEFLSNTEQQLTLRSTVKSGMGKFVIHTNKSYWGFSLGANYNNENFQPDSIADRSSWEAFISSELNLFNMGDLSLLSSVIAYPSITEQGRFRTDFKFDMKYDLPFDFYIRMGLSLNYDNQPAEGSPETDYIISTGLGWEL